MPDSRLDSQLNLQATPASITNKPTAERDPNMQTFKAKDLPTVHDTDLTLLEHIAGADHIFIFDIGNEELIPTFGVSDFKGTPNPDKTVVIETDVTNEAELLHTLERIRIIKGHHDYYGYQRTAQIGTLPEERERDAFIKQFVTIQSNRGKHIDTLMDAARSDLARLIIRHPISVDDAWGGLDHTDAEAKSKALHTVSVGLILISPEIVDVRSNLGHEAAAMLREMAQTIAVELEAMAMRLEQVPDDPFQPKARGFIVSDCETGDTVFESIFYPVAMAQQAEYERKSGRRAEISPMPVEESYKLARLLDGAKGKSFVQSMLDGEYPPRA